MKSYVDKLTVLALFLIVTLLGSCINPLKVTTDEAVRSIYVQNNDMLEMTAYKELLNGRIYGDFEQQKMLYRESYISIERFYENARKVKKTSDFLVSRIDQMKFELIAEIENITLEEAFSKPFEMNNIKNWGSNSAANDFFSADSEVGKATELKEAIENFKKELQNEAFFPNKNAIEYAVKLNLDTEPITYQSTWEKYYFKDRPAIAMLYELSKWQYHIREAEHQMIRYFYGGIIASSYKFDAVRAIIIPKSYTVKRGENFDADVMIAAYNASENPLIKVKGKTISKFIDGKGIYKERATTIGKKNVRGAIYIRDPLTGVEHQYEFETEYEVIPAQ